MPARLPNLRDVDWVGITVFAIALSICVCLVVAVVGVALLGRDVSEDASHTVAGLLGACVGIVSTYIGFNRSESRQDKAENRGHE